MFSKLYKYIKSKLNVRLKIMLKELLNNVYAILYYIVHINKWKEYINQPKIVYCLTPEHGNIGDAAIVCGTYSYFNNMFPNKLILEFSDDKVRSHKYIINKITQKEDIVFLHGGGNLGDWYPAEEFLRQNLVKMLKDRTIISLPQTISFGNKNKSEWIKVRAKKIYNSHRNFTLICRDETSYKFAAENFPNGSIMQLPDMALNLPKYRETHVVKKSGVLLCLRSDIEKKRTDEFDKGLYEICKKHYSNIEYTDTMVAENIYANERLEIVNEKIELFKNYKLIITDRYHGVIFAFLSNTPCIALDNSDHKVRENCKYFKDTGFIKMAKNLNEIESLICGGLDEIEKKDIDFYDQHFRLLTDLIMKVKS